MVKFEPDLRGGTDIAALSGGIVAVSVSIFTGNGEYGPLNLVVSATLTAALIGYVWRGLRRKMQSVAVSAVLAFALVPGFGFISEAAHSKDIISYFNGSYRWDCNLEPCSTDNRPESRVTQKDLLAFWLFASIYVLCIDRITQEVWRQSLAEDNSS